MRIDLGMFKEESLELWTAVPPNFVIMVKIHSMNLSKIAFFIALLTFLQMPSEAQEWVSYQSQQQVNDLLDTGEELLLATDAGLVVINKTTLEKKIFNTGNSKLPLNHIQTITNAPNGDFFIGVYDLIVARFDGSEFEDITTPESDKYDEHTRLYDFKIAPNGDFWLGTTDGIFHREGQTWRHYDENDLGQGFFEAWDIAINDMGEVFVGSNDVFKFANGTWTNISGNTQLTGYLDADLFFAESGDLFVAGDLDQIGRFDGVEWHEYPNFDVVLNGSEIKGFTEDTDGNIYFNTLRDGIFKLVGDTWTQQVDAQTTAFDNKTPYFYIDAQNNRWMNSDIHLSVNKNGNIQTTTISQHTLSNNGIKKIRKSSNGTLYFLTNANEHLSVLAPNGNWSFFPLFDSSTPGLFINDVLFLAENNILVASSLGLHHYNGTDWQLTSLDACRAFAVDSKGKIYIQASSKIYILADGVISEYNTDNSPISSLIITGLGLDANENLWIASFDWDGNNAIQKVTADGSWTTFSGIDHPVINHPSGEFHFDNQGNVWVASGFTGAIRYDGTDWTNPLVENRDQIESTDVHAIEIDQTGKLYFSHQYGVTTLLEDQWDDLLIEEVPNESSSHRSDIEFDDAGNLWWGSSRYGLFAYTPESITSTFKPLESLIDFSLYPNPTVDFAILDFTLAETALVKMQVYNNLGQLQSQWDLGQLPVGDFRQSLELSHFQAGFYSVQLQIGEQSLSKTFMIQ